MTCVLLHGLLGYTPSHGGATFAQGSRQLHGPGLRASAQGSGLLSDPLRAVFPGTPCYRDDPVEGAGESGRMRRRGLHRPSQGQGVVPNALPAAAAARTHAVSGSETTPAELLGNGLREPPVREATVPQPLRPTTKVVRLWFGRGTLRTTASRPEGCVRDLRVARTGGGWCFRQDARTGDRPLSRSRYRSSTVVQQLQPRTGLVQRRPGTPFQSGPLRGIPQGQGLEG